MPSCPLPSYASRRPSGTRPATLLASLAALLLAPTAVAAEDAGPAPAPAPIRIALRPEVVLDRAEVTLGDVAVLTTRDLTTLRRLMAVPLGIAPRSGGAVRLERDALERWLRARAGVDPAQVEWTGASASEIHVRARELAGEIVAAAALDAARAALSRGGKRAEVAVSGSPRAVPVPPGRIALEVRPIPERAVIARRLSVWVDVSAGGRFVRTVPVSLDVKVFAPAWVATRDGTPGQLLEGSGLEVREVEWSGRDAPPLAGDSGAPLRLRRPLAAGEAVTRAHVEPAPEVARGTWATLRSRRGAVELESRVEVLQDGFPGQTVRVKLPNASSAILARVAGPGSLEIAP